MKKSKVDLQAMADKWPSAYVAREEVGRFTGGIVSPKTQANLDSKGEGPADAVRVGRKVAYSVPAYITWLEGRATAGRVAA